MSKRDLRPKRKHKPCAHELEFMPVELKGLPKAPKQFGDDGFRQEPTSK